MNIVTLHGNLGADPELRFTQNGTAVLNMRLATTEKWNDSNGVKQERTDWHSIVIWGKRGEALSKYLSKGSELIITGKLRNSSYDDKDGIKRYKTEIVVQGPGDTVEFCGRRSDGDRQQQSSGSGGGGGNRNAGGSNTNRSNASSGKQGGGASRQGPPQEYDPNADMGDSGNFGGDGGDDDIPF